MEQYTTFTTNKKGHLLVHPVLAAFIILVVLAVAVVYVYIKTQTNKNPIVDIAQDTLETESVQEISFTENQTSQEKKDIIFNRFSTVYSQPLYQKERQAIFYEYGDTNRANLTDVEKQQIIRALNTY